MAIHFHKSGIVMKANRKPVEDAPHEEADQVKRLMKEMMTTAAKLRVPLDVDMQQGSVALWAWGAQRASSKELLADALHQLL